MHNPSVSFKLVSFGAAMTAVILICYIVWKLYSDIFQHTDTFQWNLGAGGVAVGGVLVVVAIVRMFFIHAKHKKELACDAVDKRPANQPVPA